MCSLRIDTLDIPLPGGGGVGEVDWREGAIGLTLTTPELRGRLLDDDPRTPDTFEFGRSAIKFGSLDIAANGVGIYGQIPCTIDGATTTGVTIDITARELTDDAGRLHSGGPQVLRGVNSMRHRAHRAPPPTLR